MVLLMYFPRLVLIVTVLVALQPVTLLAMEVQVVGRDVNGNLVLKSGDLTTPAGLSGGLSTKALQALGDQGGVGPLYGNIQFSAIKPVFPVVPEAPPPPLPSQIMTSLQLVAEPTPISYGLSYGGIAIPHGTLVPGSASTQSNQVTGHFTLDGTVGGPKLTKLAMFAGPTFVPLPGSVPLFLTGLMLGVLVYWSRGGLFGRKASGRR